MEGIDWTTWVSFAEALVMMPKSPGVYEVRQAIAPNVVYVGSAGLRDSGGQKQPRGLRGRFERYASGKALASGLGEAVFDRALRDTEWLRARLADVETGNELRATDWGKLAFEWAGLEVRWVTTADAASAKLLERNLIRSHEGLWNRRLHATTPKVHKPRRYISPILREA